MVLRMLGQRGNEEDGVASLCLLFGVCLWCSNEKDAMILLLLLAEQ